jgi:hypothetical protein
MADPLFIHALFWPLLVILATASAGAHLVERRGWPRFLGALMVGVLLGPMVFGRIAPPLQRLIFRGGTDETMRLDRLTAEQDQQLAALKSSGVTETAIQEKQQEWTTKIHEARAAIDRAEQRYRQPLDLLMAAGVFPLVLIRLGIRITGGDPTAPMRPLMGMMWLGPMAAMALGGSLLEWAGVWAAAAVSGLSLGWLGLPRSAMRTLSTEALQPVVWCYLAMQLRW